MVGRLHNHAPTSLHAALQATPRRRNMKTLRFTTGRRLSQMAWSDSLTIMSAAFCVMVCCRYCLPSPCAFSSQIVSLDSTAKTCPLLYPRQVLACPEISPSSDVKNAKRKSSHEVHLFSRTAAIILLIFSWQQFWLEGVDAVEA